MNLGAGGHISHGHPATLTGKHFRIVSYGVDDADECVDFDEVEALALKHHPKLIIAGGSAYPRQLEFENFRQIADRIDACLMTDMAHFAGLVVSGHHVHPFPHSHIVTTTTYKSLRGARGGMILTDDPALDKKLSTGVFPGVQGSVLLHGVAGKAACLAEALKPEFSDYCGQVVANASVLADDLHRHGVGLVSHGTDTGMVLVNLNRTTVNKRLDRITGAAVVDSLERAGIAANKNVIPRDDLPPELASGFRISTNAGTTRGFTQADYRQISQWIVRTVKAVAAGVPDALMDEERQIRTEVRDLCSRYPFYEA